MDEVENVSGAEETAQDASGATQVVQEPSEAAPQVQEQPNGGEPKTEPTPEEVEAQRRLDQAETDKQNRLREVNAQAEAAERRAQAAEARAQALESQRQSEAEQQDKARLRQLRQDDPDAYLEEMDRRERETEVRNSTFGQAHEQGKSTAFQVVYNVERARAKEAGLTDAEINQAIAEAGKANGFTDTVPFAVAADALVGARFAKVGGDVPTLREENKTLKEENTALKNQLAGLNLDVAGGPPKSPGGGGSSTPLKSKDLDGYTAEQIAALSDDVLYAAMKNK